MKRHIRDIGKYAHLYRDDKSGITWIEDGSTGIGYSVHSNIDATGSVRGMKHLGYWEKEDRTIRSHGFIYNIDSFICDPSNEFEALLAEECRCQGCIERREKETEKENSDIER